MSHQVTTVMVTVVHPDDYSPEDVRGIVDCLVANKCPDSWGLGLSVASSAVEVTGTCEDGDPDTFVPNWRRSHEPRT